jgi:hypothetical protein
MERLGRLVAGIGLCVTACLLTGSGCAYVDEQEGQSLIDDASRIYPSLPTFPGATVIGKSSSLGHEDETGPVTIGTVVLVFRLPTAATARAVERFYSRRLMAAGWRLRERLPGRPRHADGPVLNFRAGRRSVSVNLEGVYDHQMELTVSIRAL